MSNEIRAPLTGTIWRIHKQVGQAVAAGEAVITLESMKMEMPIEAPRAGTVEKLLVREGDAVSEGDVLMHLA